MLHYYYIEVSAQGVSDFLHLVTNVDSKKKVTMMLKNFTKYSISVHGCKYKETCQYLDKDPFLGLNEFIDKLANLKLYYTYTYHTYKKVDKWHVYDTQEIFKHLKLTDVGFAYDRVFLSLESDNYCLPDTEKIVESLRTITGEVWRVSAINHPFYYDPSANQVKLDEEGRLCIQKSEWEIDGIQEEKIEI